MARKSTAKKPKGKKVDRGLCFVIMPYGEPFDRYYENIYASAIKGAGLKPIRADSLFRSSAILGDIWQLTRRAKVLLADMTGRNPNVFYELGLAHAIAQPVVLVASSIEDVPFDLRGLRVIIYDKNNESWGDKLRDSIRMALKETLADLNTAVPPTFLEAIPSRRGPGEEPVMLELRKLQDTVRAIQTSLPHWLRHLIATGGEADTIKRYIAAIKYLDCRLDRPISLGEGMRVMGSIFKGYARAATFELRKATGLSLDESEKFVKELTALAKPPRV